jgi:hypothetical protein
MNWIQLIEAFAIGAVLVSLADWIFFGVIFHGKYYVYPEVWRPINRWRVPLAGVIALLTPLAFTALAAAMDLTDFHDVIHLAVLMWIAGPLPLLAVNGFFLKLHPAVTVTHIIGWLVKFLGAAAGVIIAQLL